MERQKSLQVPVKCNIEKLLTLQNQAGAMIVSEKEYNDYMNDGGQLESVVRFVLDTSSDERVIDAKALDSLLIHCNNAWNNNEKLLIINYSTLNKDEILKKCKGNLGKILNDLIKPCNEEKIIGKCGFTSGQYGEITVTIEDTEASPAAPSFTR